MEKMIIAVDGPSGSGKGTLAANLASHLGYLHLDTGLLYRITGYKMLQAGLNLENSQLAEDIASSISLGDFRDETVLRNEAVAQAASRVAVYPSVRTALLKFQRHFAHNPPEGAKGVILDGRDIGTVVCPDAQVKLFVTASLKERANRRLKELQNRGINSIYETVFEDVRSRDERDTKREMSPLKPSEDALVLDTSELTIDDVFKKALSYVEAKRRFFEAESSTS